MATLEIEEYADVYYEAPGQPVSMVGRLLATQKITVTATSAATVTPFQYDTRYVVITSYGGDARFEVDDDSGVVADQTSRTIWQTERRGIYVRRGIDKYIAAIQYAES